LYEIDGAEAVLLAEVEEDAEVDAAGAELLLELLELLQPAATRTAAAAAAAVSPARADTEYNGVPRSFTQTCRERHVRDQIRITRSQLTGLLAEMLGLPGETFALTLS
jgi:Tfp pilus assembly protein PilZ